MTQPGTANNSKPIQVCMEHVASERPLRCVHGLPKGITHRFIHLLSLVLATATLSLSGYSQVISHSEESSLRATSSTPRPLDTTYAQPTRRVLATNYVFDTFGPYPVATAALEAGWHQVTNSPPEWHQGVEGYSKRLGSDFGTSVVGTTTRYVLAGALKEDTMYYRCECRGAFPRLSHALLSTLTGRRGDDGHRVFSLPALVSPYAGSMTAVYGWYPDRFNAKDAFRMGNYSLLLSAGGNVSLEFLYSGPHSLLSRMHLNNSHGALDPGPNH